MDFDVIEKSGSDASYDLVIEAIEPKPSGGYIVNSINNANNGAAEELISKLIDTRKIEAVDWGIRFNFFQHIPDKWVFAARLEALFKKMETKNSVDQQ